MNSPILPYVPENTRIEIILGCMYSGKSTELLRRTNRYQAIGKNILLINHTNDIRTGDSVKTHRNETENALKITNLMDIFITPNQRTAVFKADVIGIDEAQFFDNNLINVCNDLAKAGKRVVVAGLDKDYAAQAFGPIQQLIVDAEYVTKVNAICMVCGDPASFTQRISAEKDLVVVGETDKYEARCRKCYEI
jgi:thymidine kinase